MNLTIPERNASFVHQMAWKQSKSNNGYSTGTLDCANNEHNDVGDFDSIAAWFKGPASLSILPLNCQGLKILSIEGCGASIKIDEIFDVENINLTVPLSLDIEKVSRRLSFHMEVATRSAARYTGRCARRFKTKIYVRQQYEGYID